MTYNLERFITAQERDFEQAYKEIQNGEKQTHWMWYIFPQIKGLGFSDHAIYYGIESIEEAKAYWDNDYLKGNLTKICLCLLSIEGKSALDIFGYIDYLKLKSSMTLFLEATKEQIFSDVLNKFYDGELDQRTLQLVRKAGV